MYTCISNCRPFLVLLLSLLSFNFSLQQLQSVKPYLQKPFKWSYITIIECYSLYILQVSCSTIFYYSGYTRWVEFHCIFQMHRFCLHISGLSSTLCLFAPIQPKKGICREHSRIWNVLERGLILTIHISVMCVSKIGSPYLPYPSLYQSLVPQLTLS